jgi:ABC-type branched-subunit amino acid transport system ATPase component
VTTLVLENVARHFGGVPAVDGVSLQVPAGQITGLIGPNGAGKTTVVNLITGILHLTSGSVLLDGKDVSRAEAPELARAGVARTFQNIRLVADASVLDNVLAGFHPRVLLLDEPVAGMNDAEAESLAGIFRNVAASGVAVLLIEHNMRFVMSLCSKLYVVASGRLIAQGEPEAVGRDPVVVEAYLGA